LIEEITLTLLERHRASGRVHLNDLAEVIGARAVTPEEIEHVIDRLEAEGLRVGEALDDQDIDALRAVLESARRLRGSLGRQPCVEELAADTGRPAHEVRRALEHVRRTARSGPPG
jgi:hypothetical protein